MQEDQEDQEDKAKEPPRRCRCGYPLNVCWRCSSPDEWGKEKPSEQ